MSQLPTLAFWYEFASTYSYPGPIFKAQGGALIHA